MRFFHIVPLLLLLVVIPNESFSIDRPQVQNVAGKILGSVVAPAMLATAPMVSTAIEPMSDNEPSAAPGVERLISLQQKDSTNTEGYLPRRLYPGTYANYCGPTPEVRVKDSCAAHGWHGDDPVDRVDAACRIHDVSYCNCETQFLSRRNAAVASSKQNAGGKEDEEIPLLSSMVALRFATKSALEKTAHADAEYFDCINKADRRLIAAGVKIRAEEQRNGCSTDPSLSWFCDLKGKGTLATFERVNLSIFLKDIESDGIGSISVPRTDGGRGRMASPSLSKLEQRRYEDIQKEIKGGKSIAEAASSKVVEADEEQMLRILAVEDIDGVTGMQ